MIKLRHSSYYFTTTIIASIYSNVLFFKLSYYELLLKLSVEITTQHPFQLVNINVRKEKCLYV